jgi:hypothetical protein
VWSGLLSQHQESRCNETSGVCAVDEMRHQNVTLKNGMVGSWRQGGLTNASHRY